MALRVTCMLSLKLKRIPISNDRNADLYCTVPVIHRSGSPWVRKFKVLGLNGEENVKIPEGTQTGEIIRLKGKGLPDPHGGGKGDLYVNIHRRSLTKLTRSSGGCSNSLARHFRWKIARPSAIRHLFDKVKDIFG